jgi:hypothetical protein
MKYKFPAKPLKCRQKNLTLISIKKNEVAKHDSLLIAKQISQGLDVFSSFFGKDNTEEVNILLSCSFRMVSSNKTQKYHPK